MLQLSKEGVSVIPSTQNKYISTRSKCRIQLSPNTCLTLDRLGPKLSPLGLARPGSRAGLAAWHRCSLLPKLRQFASESVSLNAPLDGSRKVRISSAHLRDTEPRQESTVYVPPKHKHLNIYSPILLGAAQICSPSSMLRTFKKNVQGAFLLFECMYFYEINF